MNNKRQAKDGYPQICFNGPTKHYCQVLQLKNDAALIEKYRDCHNHIWPDIAEGIRSVGILEMEIYIQGNQLVMIVETPLDFDWDTAFTRLAQMNRQQEWEAFVGQFQQAEPGCSSSEKWHLMERMFALTEHL